ncbi:class I SAM-dependent methyltransferase [Porticoccaceae bacterium nBUS_09]
MKLNLGCGNQVVDGWINVDYFLGARLVKIPGFSLFNRVFRMFDMEWDKRIFLHDLTKPLPWGEGVASGIYTSHTLEHLNKEDGRALLNEAYRVLSPGGILRIIVPDLNVVLGDLREGKFTADELMYRLGVRLSQPKGFLGIIKKLSEYPHQCMYDNSSMVNVLEAIGFEVSLKKGFESAIEDIDKIEIEGRVVDAVIVEAVKPH